MARQSPSKVGQFQRRTVEAEAEIAALNAPRLLGTPVRSTELPIGRIRPNPFQARTNFEGLDELAQAIRAQGFISRLRVRHDPADEGYYQLIYGERRLRAAQLAGLTLVPCDVAEHSDDELIEWGLMENVQREDLDPLEEARAFRQLIEQRGYTQVRLAERIGKDRFYVSRRLKLLEMPDDVQQLIRERPDTVQVAHELVRLSSAEERKPLIAQVRQGTLGLRGVQDQVRAADARAAADEPVAALPEASHVHVDGAGVPANAGTSNDSLPGPATTGLAVSRDIRAVRRIFASWVRDGAVLEAEHHQALLAYMDEHVGQVERLLQILKEHA